MFGKPKRPPRIWVFCDGGQGHADDDTLPLILSPQGHRSPATAQSACAAVAHADGGAILAWECRRLSGMTNNEAEYNGLLLGLQIARRLGALETICILDNEVVVDQMNGHASVHSSNLLRWHWQACEAARALRRVHFCAIPREWNRLADALTHQVGIPWAELQTHLWKVIEQGGKP